MTRAGAHGLDLSMAASYSARCGEDEDEAAVNHRLAVKLGEEHVYAPEDGLTTPVPHFKDDIAPSSSSPSLTRGACLLWLW